MIKWLKLVDGFNKKKKNEEDFSFIFLILGVIVFYNFKKMSNPSNKFSTHWRKNLDSSNDKDLPVQQTRDGGKIN